MAINFQGDRPISSTPKTSTFKFHHETSTFELDPKNDHFEVVHRNDMFFSWNKIIFRILRSELDICHYDSSSGVIRSPFEIIFLDHFRLIFLKFMNFLIQVRSLLKPGFVVPALDILHKLPYGTAEFTLRYYYNVILEGLQLVTLPYSPPYLSPRHPICYFVICTAQNSL